MKIKEVPIKDIKPYDNNPRLNDSAIMPVAESIKRFGFQQPIVIDKNSVVVVGHTRLMAAKQLEMETVPCVIAENLSEAEANSYRIADNKYGEIADWDYDALATEFEKMDVGALTSTGFSTLEIEKIIEEARREVDEPTEPEETETSFAFTIKCESVYELERLQQLFLTNDKINISFAVAKMAIQSAQSTGRIERFLSDHATDITD